MEPAHDTTASSFHQPIPSQHADLVIDAIYEDGVIKPLAPLDLPPGTSLQLRLERRITIVASTSTAADATTNGAALPSTAPAGSVWRRPWPHPRAVMGALAARIDMGLFVVGLLVYAITRFVALDQFPIYFFSDEAIQTTLASDLLRNGLRDYTGTLLPPYFLNAYYWNLSLSVYAQVIGVLLFGKSILVTRGTSALITILSAIAVSLTLKTVFKQRLWWTGALVVALIPAWFLHSRTAFETALSVSFYACFLGSYLLYRYRSPRYLYLALVMGAATFYSYANGQGVMFVTGALLLLSDARYHWKQRQDLCLLGGAAVLGIVLATPYLRFRALHPEALESQLRRLSSYWFEPLPLSSKLATFGSNYLQGLSPFYWFFPNDVDLIRHRMAGMGHIPIEFLPLVVVGLAVCVWHWRSSAHRALLIALLAVPFSPALVGIGITRVLFMIVPAALLTCLGIEQCYSWLQRRIAYVPFALACTSILGIMSLGMLRSALVDGPTWYNDYGLGGMQYGAKQLFDTISDKLVQEPDSEILLSPTWANGTDVFPQFFLTPAQQERVKLLNIDGFITYKQELSDRQLFIMPEYEYKIAIANDKLVVGPPEQIVPYPDGTPGFYFVRMHYSATADARFAADEAERQKPVVEEITLDGQPVQVSHSLLDIGQLHDLFDNDTHSLARGMEANPLVFELRFPTPRPIASVSIDTASTHFRLKIEAIAAAGGAPRTFDQTYSDMPADPHIDATLPDSADTVRTLRIEITDLDVTPGQRANIHVREIALH